MLHDPAFMTESEEFPEVELPDGQRFRRTWRVERFVEQVAMRYYFRYELEHLLANCGYRVEALYGDFDRSPLGDESPEMIFVAAKAG
jgi:hypothetical protein